MKLTSKKLKLALLTQTILGLGLISDVVYAQTAPENMQPQQNTLEALQKTAQALQNTAPEAGNSDIEETARRLQNISPEAWEKNYVILATVVDKKLLSNGIFVIEKDGKYYLPITELGRQFGFFINPKRENGALTGWISTPQERFSIDGQNLIVTKRKEKIAIASDSILTESQTNENDLFVDLETLNYLWPVEMDLSLTTLVLDIKSEKELPFQKDIKRKSKQSASLNNLFKDGNTVYPYKAEPYKAFTKPVLSINSSLGYEASNNDYRSSVAFSGAQDLLYTGADYSIRFTEDQSRVKNPENFRLRFTRQNIHQDALPLGLETVRAGDVRLENRNLISSGSSGRGVTFNNIPLDRSREFDSTTIEGVALPGYEVELYRNDALLDVGIVSNDGIYRFEDVPLSYGNNNIDVVLYGPQGQRTEINESYYIGGNMIKVGETQYSGGIVDAERDLIPINEREENRILARGTAANFQVFHGLSKDFSVFGTGTLIPTKRNGDKKYISLGFITSAFDALSKFELYRSDDNGYALDASMLKNVGKYNLNLGLSLFDDFESPSNNFGDNTTKLEANARVQRSFQTALGALRLEFSGRHRARENDTSDTRLTSRQSISRSGTQFTNSLTTNLIKNSEDTLNGRLSATKRLKKWRFRGDLGYLVKPEWDLSNVQASARYRFNPDYTGQFTVNYSPISDQTRTTLQLSRDFKAFLGSAETNWSSTAGAGFMLRASTSLGPYGDDDNYIASSRQLNTASPILADIYHDKNYNSVYDASDEPIENAKVILDRTGNGEESGANGRLRILNNYTNAPINARVSTRTIDDPYLQPTIAGYSVFSRPGVAQKLTFPVVDTGAMDATLSDPKTGESLVGVDISLLDSRGRIVQTTRTAPDGYFTFEFLVPDQYTLKTENISSVGYFEKDISITPDNLFNFGVSLTTSDIKQDPLVTALGETRELLRRFQSEQN